MNKVLVLYENLLGFSFGFDDLY